jgi:hypothetical protein
MKEDTFVDLALKGELYENQYFPKMFSAYFENIRQLQSFLKLSSYLVSINNVCETLALNYKVFQGLKKGG